MRKRNTDCHTLYICILKGRLYNFTAISRDILKLKSEVYLKATRLTFNAEMHHFICVPFENFAFCSVCNYYFKALELESFYKSLLNNKSYSILFSLDKLNSWTCSSMIEKSYFKPGPLNKIFKH